MADSTKFTHIGNVVKNIRREAFGPDLSVDAVAKIITDIAKKNPIEEHGPKPFKCSKNVIYKIESGATSVPSKEFLDYFCLATMIQDTYEPFLRRLYESYVNFEWIRHDPQSMLLDLLYAISCIKVSEAWFKSDCLIPPKPDFDFSLADVTVDTPLQEPFSTNSTDQRYVKLYFAKHGITLREHHTKKDSAEIEFILYFNRVAAFIVSKSRTITLVTDDHAIRLLLQHTHSKGPKGLDEEGYFPQTYLPHIKPEHRSFYSQEPKDY
jgi:hypothetical protein